MLTGTLTVAATTGTLVLYAACWARRARQEAGTVLAPLWWGAAALVLLAGSRWVLPLTVELAGSWPGS